MKKLVFLPTFNEEETIQTICEKILSLVQDADILVIDDNSTDKTIPIVQHMQETHTQITLIVREGIRGRGLAEVDAYRYALENDYAFFVEMDADLSHNPEYLPQFFETLKKTDIVLGSRFIPGGEDADRSLVRKLTSLSIKLFSCIILRIPLSDPTTGYRGFKKHVIEYMMKYSINAVGPEMLLETSKIFLAGSFDIEEIPIRFIDRTEGKSKVTVHTLMQYMRYVFFHLVFYRTKTCDEGE